METILNQQSRENLISRIEKLNENSQPLWGKMSVYQMLKHCSQWEEMALGKQVYKQSLLGKLVGKIALKDMLTNKPMKPNLPTVPSFKIKEEGDANAEKVKLITLLEEHGQCENNGFVHPFFGRLTCEQGGQIAYKHADHHLRQFGV
jgi:hypothetical protein